MIVKKYNVDLACDWERVVSNSKNGNFLFSRNYMDYHSHRYIDESILIYRNDRPLAVFPCNRNDLTVFSHGGLTYGGLLIGIEVHALDVLSIFELISDYFKSKGANKIIYKAIPSVFHRYPAQEDLYALNRVGAKLFRRDLSSVIQLDSVPKFSDSRKNTARKSEKAGAVVIELFDLLEFHNLLTFVLKKFGVLPVHSLEELQLLKSRFPEQIRLFGCILDDQLLAATLIYDFGHLVHTQYMASSDEGRRLGSLDFLLMKLIQDDFSKKSYFSFGISTEDSGQILNEGLSRQKEGFGGRGIVHDFYEWVL